MKDRQLWIAILVPLLVAGLFAGLNLIDFYSGAERGVYDLLLHVKPAIAQEESLLFLDIDDTSIAEVGQFPWSRDIMADGLIVLKEFGASYAVFDIEYTEQSPRGVNVALLNEEIPEIFGQEFSVINQNIEDLFGAIQSGMISLGDAQDYVRDLTGLTDISRNILLEKVREISRDNDAYFGRAARLFGKAYFTVNMLPEEEDTAGEQLESYVLENIALPVQTAEGFAPDESIEAVDIRPAILPVIQGANGADLVDRALGAAACEGKADPGRARS